MIIYHYNPKCFLCNASNIALYKSSKLFVPFPLIYKEFILHILTILHSVLYGRYIAEILPIRRKTLSNQSINSVL